VLDIELELQEKCKLCIVMFWVWAFSRKRLIFKPMEKVQFFGLSLLFKVYGVAFIWTETVQYEK
jgi:hypothetical protein